MELRYLTEERQWGREENRPDLQGKVLEGKRGRILVTIYRAGGAGLHPTVLLLHGIPGVERNFDLAQGLRRVGFHVVTCHYSGSWNSDGAYSIGHCLEDSEAVLDFILRDDAIGFDKEQLFLVGHSMGCFLGAQLAAKRKEISGLVTIAPCDLGEAMLEGETGRKQLLEIFEDAVPWLNGTTAERLLAETEQNAEWYRLSFLADKLMDRPIYCVSGTLDTGCPAEIHAKPWVAAVQAAGGAVRYEEWETDHAFSEKRLTLQERTAKFLVEQVKKA